MVSSISRTGIKTGTISWSVCAILLISLVSFWHLLHVRLSDERWKFVIASDGAGYYAYLPATFIYHDLTYDFAEKTSPVYQSYPGVDIHFFGTRTLEGKRTNKYFIGTSVMQLPFFLFAWTLSSVFDYPPGGYSYLYQLFICLAGIFYLFAGLFFIRKLLLRMEFSDTLVSMVILLLFFGTNLYYYALEEPAMSHVYSFAAISFFLCIARELFNSYSRKNLILFAFTFALIILIRPTNGIVLFFIPFFLNREKAKTLFRNLVADKTGIIFALLAAFGLFFLQGLSWKFTTGNWLEDLYPGENLNFAHPHLADVLVSWRKGFFIYTPLMLFGIAGMFFARSFVKSFFLILFFCANAYIISSWHDWSYGGSFGMRPFVDTYAVMAIPLAYFFRAVRNKLLTISIFPLIFFFVFLNLFQIYQYHIGILPFEYMNWNKYKRIFMKSDRVFVGIFSPGSDEIGNLPENVRQIYSCKRNFDNDMFTNQLAIVRDEKYFSPNRAARLDDKNKLCADLYISEVIALRDFSPEHAWLKASAKVWLDEDATDAKMIISFKDDKNAYEWNGFFIVHRVGKTKCWQDYSIVIPLPPIHSKEEVVSIYVLKNDNKLLYVDDLEISVWK